MSSLAFVEFLASQRPHYDEVILKSILPSDGWLSDPKPYLDALKIDGRFLPNKLRSLWAFRKEHPRTLYWRIGKKFRLKTATVEKRLQTCDDIIFWKVRNWLKSLTPQQRRRERYKRTKTWRTNRKTSKY